MISDVDTIDTIDAEVLKNLEDARQGLETKMVVTIVEATYQGLLVGCR